MIYYMCIQIYVHTCFYILEDQVLLPMNFPLKCPGSFKAVCSGLCNASQDLFSSEANGAF